MIHVRTSAISFMFYVMLIKSFERRIGETAMPKGAKAELVRQAIVDQKGQFRLSDIERACPGVGREWIQKLLVQLKEKGEVSCLGKVLLPAGSLSGRVLRVLDPRTL